MPKHLSDPVGTITVPPLYGRGSTLNAWTTYANGLGYMSFPSNLSRDQLVAYLYAHGLPRAQPGGTATIATDPATNGDQDSSKTP